MPKLDVYSRWGDKIGTVDTQEEPELYEEYQQRGHRFVPKGEKLPGTEEAVVQQRLGGDVVGPGVGGDAFWKAVEARAKLGERWGAKEPVQEAQQMISDDVARFTAQWKNQFGEEPDQGEIVRYLENVVIPRAGHFEGGQQQIEDLIRSHIAEFGRVKAQEQAISDLRAQKVEAGRLSDLFRQQGSEALGRISSNLQDYSTRLFERLMPQLQLSAEAAGVRTSGGREMMEQGAMETLGRELQNDLAQRSYDMERQAQAIRFAGEAAPYEYERSLALGRPEYLAQMGQGALERAYQQAMQQQGVQGQISLLREQPRQDFWTQFGQQALLGGIQGLSSGLGSKLIK